MDANLIPYTPRAINGETVQTVDGRDVHAFLQIQKHYGEWIKVQIKRANLLRDSDYAVLHQQVLNPQGGRPTQEYFLTFEAAKHVAMVSGAPKGREVREYFIACEKALQARPTPAIDHYPELQAIVQLVQSTAEARLIAETAQREASEAKLEAAQATALAHQVANTQQRFTVAEYIRFEHLGAKVPASAYKACSDHLRAYCLDHNIPFRRVPVAGKAWPEEYEFHISVYAEAFPGWLTRRYSQPDLTILPGGA